MCTDPNEKFENFFFTNFMGQFLKNVVARVLATKHFGLTTSQAVILHKICFFRSVNINGYWPDEKYEKNILLPNSFDNISKT